MRLKPLFVFLALLFLAQSSAILQAQSKKLSPLSKTIQDLKKQEANSTKLAPFERSQNAVSSDISLVVSNATLLQLYPNRLTSQLSQESPLLEFSFPYKDDLISLELYEANLFDPDFQLTTSDSNGEAVAYTQGKYYRGIIKNRPNSQASISIVNGEVYGFASYPSGEQIILGKLNKPGNHTAYIAYAEQDLLVAPTFECHADELPPHSGLTEELYEQLSQNVNNPCVRFYLEGDNALRLNKGGVTQASDYITALFNQVAILFQNESITILISEIFIWTSPDNYSRNDSGDALNQFRSRRPNYNGDLAHLLALGGNNIGGVAWLDGLCNSFGYAYSNIDASYNQVPAYSWSVGVVAHEIGHNLDSPHTHWCGWSGGAIDNCAATEGSCSPGPTPSNGGTIMSYCHLGGNPGINFNNGFGPQPGDRIRNYTNNAGCLSSCDGPDPCGIPSNLLVTDITERRATLSWTAVPEALSYTVEIRPFGTQPWTTYANLTSTTLPDLGSPNPNFFYLDPCTVYECRVRAICALNFGEFTSPVLFTTAGCSPYCNAYGTDPTLEPTPELWIESVFIDGISNTSGNNWGYGDFTHISGTLFQGESYALSLLPGFLDAPIDVAWAIYIDLNQDFDFDDPNELVYSSQPRSVPINGSFIMPISGLPGQTRMRVVMQAFNTPPACGEFLLGEVEDYMVNIIEYIPICETPTDLKRIYTDKYNGLIEDTPRLPFISWSPVLDAERYTVQFRESGDVQWTTFSNRPDTLYPTWIGIDPDIRYHIPCTDYEYRVQAHCPENSSSFSEIFEFNTGACSDYCLSYATDPDYEDFPDEYIEFVMFSNFFHHSELDFGYNDFTDSIVSLIPGETYEFSSIISYWDSERLPTFWSIWIDYNQDNDFDDPEEKTYYSDTSYTRALIGATFTVPDDAMTGITRMRIAMHGDSIIAPCGEYFNGETLDYSVNISDVPCGKPNNFRATEVGYTHVILEWDPIPEGDHYVFRYQEKGRGVNFIGGVDSLFSNSIEIIGLQPDFEYVFQVGTKCGDTFSNWSTITVRTAGGDDPYCFSHGYRPPNIIRTVSFSDLTNETLSRRGYDDFTHLTANVEKGNTYPLEITPLSANANVDLTWVVWIDFNQDFDFDDAGEFVVNTETKGFEILSEQIEIPTLAKAGTTRMRVGLKPSNTPTNELEDPCSRSFSFKVQDYTINIQDQLILSPESLTFIAAGETKATNFKVTDSWSIIDQPSWITSVNPNAGPINFPGGENIQISCVTNYSTSSRQGQIIFQTENGGQTILLDVSQEGAIPSIEVQPNALAFEASGAPVTSNTFSVVSNESWTIIQKPNWISSVTPSSGNANAPNSTVATVICAINSAITGRSGQITLQNTSGTQATIAVTQDASQPSLAITPETLHFFASGEPQGSDQIQLRANTNWSLTSIPNWLSSITPSSGSFNLPDGQSITISCQANELMEGRSFNLTFELDNLGTTKSVLITQDGAAPLLTSSEDIIEFDGSGNLLSPNMPKLIANGNWIITSEPVWISSAPNNGGANIPAGIELLVQCDINPTDRPRESTIEITLENTNLKRTIQVIQGALYPEGPWTVESTASNHTIILPEDMISNIASMQLEVGDQVGVFYQSIDEQKCGGYGIWTGIASSFPVFQNDQNTQEKDGFEVDELFQLKVWKASNDQIYEVIGTYAPLGTDGIVTRTDSFAPDGLSMLTKLEAKIAFGLQLNEG